MVDRYDAAIEIGAVYMVCNGIVKPVKESKFVQQDQDMCLSFDKNTIIQRVDDDDSINQNGNGNMLTFT